MVISAPKNAKLCENHGEHAHILTYLGTGPIGKVGALIKQATIENIPCTITECKSCIQGQYEMTVFHDIATFKTKLPEFFCPKTV
eukprot:11209217-Ditylum_brightwellii.AAC.1